MNERKYDWFISTVLILFLTIVFTGFIILGWKLGMKI